LEERVPGGGGDDSDYAIGKENGITHKTKKKKMGGNQESGSFLFNVVKRQEKWRGYGGKCLLREAKQEITLTGGRKGGEMFHSW